MTGSGGWSYFSATHYMLGIRPDFEKLDIDPCIPSEWDGFEAQRIWRNAIFHIRVENPDHMQYGVRKILLDGMEADSIPVQPEGSEHEVTIIMGVNRQ
jgi:N,N'-diacetylchitobiose phosphorylase